MPLYDFICNNCKHEGKKHVFSILIGMRQANCKRTIPNMREAFCPLCGMITNQRDYSNTKIGIKSKEQSEKIIAGLVDKPRYDKALETNTVNAGFDDRRVFLDITGMDAGGLNASIEAGGPVLIEGVKCDCEFCNPKTKEPQKPTDSDIALAELIVKSGGKMRRESIVVEQQKAEARRNDYREFLDSEESYKLNDEW